MDCALITWSDRGITGPIPSHHGRRPREDVGPLLRLMTAWTRRPAYASAWVLTTPAGEAPTRALLEDLAPQVPAVECCVLPVADPTDHGQLFHALRPVLARIAREQPRDRWRHDVLLSAGTPQVQTLWVILVQAGILPARMLQVIPAVFVPDPHPEPVREVRLAIEGFPEIRALREEVERLRAAAGWTARGIVGESPALQALQVRASRVAGSDLPVLILGETGTGKELVARAIHEGSPRSRGPFVAESCAAFAEGLLASELFGHEAGAFTGALGRKRGLFELAHGGSLFLDEVGDLPLPVQAHLLRVLQEGQVRRVGGEATVRVDVRLLTATHRDLAADVRAGRFREDLWYRLRGVELRLPPLRERTGDLPLLVDHFLRHPPPARPLEVSSRVLRALETHPWPGNVRELRAEVMRWKVFCTRRVTVADLSPEILGAPAAGPSPGQATTASRLADAVQATERQVIARALADHGGNLSRAALALGIDRNTLRRKRASLGV
jgi:DNA-binding NtrC family response regulator